MSSEVERVRLVLEDSDATDFPSSRASNVRTLLIQNFLVVSPSHFPPCGMDRKQAQARLDRIRDTPARNWRERRQKARVIAASYRRRKPKPVWDGPF